MSGEESHLDFQAEVPAWGGAEHPHLLQTHCPSESNFWAAKPTARGPGRVNQTDVFWLSICMYGQDLSGGRRVGTILKSLMCVRRKSGSTSRHATCMTPSRCHPFLHFTWVSWAFAMFPLTMNIRSSPGETLVLQTTLALTLLTKDSRALILPQGLDSSWDSVQFPPPHKRPSQDLSVLQTSTPLSSPASHTRACSSYGGLFWVQTSSHTLSCPHHCILG